jgi:surface antigen
MSRSSAALLAPLVLCVFLVSACASVQQGVEDNPKAVLGGLIGAAGGGLIAAAAGGGAGWIVAGTALGGMLGGAIGHGLDERDKRMAQEAAARAFENNRAGQASVWNNPDSGNSGSVTPTQTYQLANGQYCRRYEQTINVGGQPKQSYGTACRQADGTWQIQS